MFNQIQALIPRATYFYRNNNRVDLKYSTWSTELKTGTLCNWEPKTHALVLLCKQAPTGHGSNFFKDCTLQFKH